jgi:hypothetical protein
MKRRNPTESDRLRNDPMEALRRYLGSLGNSRFPSFPARDILRVRTTSGFSGQDWE